MVLEFAKKLGDIYKRKSNCSEVYQALENKKQQEFKDSIHQLKKDVDNMIVPNLDNTNQHQEILSPKKYDTMNDDSRHQVTEHPFTTINLNEITTNTQYERTQPNSKYDASKYSLSAQQHATIQTSNEIYNDKIINILLVGETGVGKSTFISAFANYLVFHSFSQAESSEPLVIIPVSFIMTIGENFEEQEIKFGEVDSINNENFNHQGQSVTQHCKSYTFDLNDNERTKVRIIDTPGFGDTRGPDQDDQNMEHILQYINNLTHLNAICFLLKPNASRLNIFFRTCLTQLFSLLSPTVLKNIIFCFTNARSTFYTPGNTAPLLKAMLAESSFREISFTKQNVFCFDNESFRYLVALQNEVAFTDEERKEYQISWKTSVKESIRLIDYIKRELKVCYLKIGWQSIKHAQLEISYMIRPILETIRNSVRNIILLRNNLSSKIIQLMSQPLHSSATHCLSCKTDLIEVGEFFILPTIGHAIQTQCLTCSCALDKHVGIDYILEYTCSNNRSDDSINLMMKILNTLLESSALLAHFLIDTISCRSDDPFLTGFKKMIGEEQYICERKTLNGFNQQLLLELSNILPRYENERRKLKSSSNKIELSSIYAKIDVIGKLPEIYEQIKAVKETQRIIIESYEYEAQQI